MDGDITFSTSLLNSHRTSTSLNLPKVFQARVLEELQENVSLIRIGTREVVVKINEKVMIGNEYLFRFNGNSEKSLPLVEVTKLADVATPKAIQTVNTTHTASNETIANLKINTTTQQQIVMSLYQKVDKSAYDSILKWVNESNGMTKETKFLFIQHVMTKNYPIPLEKAIMNVQEAINRENNIGQLVKELISEVKNLPLKTHPEQKLEELLRNVTLQANLLQTSSQVKNVVVQSLAQLGFQYEKNILTSHFSQVQTKSKLEAELKPILIALQQQLPTAEMNRKIEKMVQMLNGFQLQSREDGLFQPLFFAIPYLNNEQYKNWYIHIQARNTEKEKVDPSHCRILFLLDLPVLSETMVDILIQEKVISVSITNNFTKLDEIVQKYKSILMKKLEEDGYMLLSLKVIKNEDKHQDVYNVFLQEVLKPPNKGVDIKL
ncbi:MULTISPECIES: hypothetical protein [Bacillus]|uniref:hypothetical protein n=1 Tax=Bacillus TaxID=1386 RepID=UPI000BB84522|nr:MULTISPECIES: hypothetical protein [Bacillus]